MNSPTIKEYFIPGFLPDEEPSFEEATEIEPETVDDLFE